MCINPHTEQINWHFLSATGSQSGACLIQSPLLYIDLIGSSVRWLARTNFVNRQKPKTVPTALCNIWGNLILQREGTRAGEICCMNEIWKSDFTNLQHFAHTFCASHRFKQRHFFFSGVFPQCPVSCTAHRCLQWFYYKTVILYAMLSLWCINTLSALGHPPYLFITPVT